MSPLQGLQLWCRVLLLQAAMTQLQAGAQMPAQQDTGRRMLSPTTTCWDKDTCAARYRLRAILV